MRERIVAAIRKAAGELDLEGVVMPEIIEGAVGAQARAIGGASLPLFSRYLIDTNVLFKEISLMLKGLNPILSPELLATLRAMGHGDEIALVDGNYPGLEHGRRLIRLDGHHLIPVLDAILSVMPIDDFVPEAIFRATVKQDRDALDPVHRGDHRMLRQA